ncbi:hypothetical protein MRX96_004700 [Rhipicephalus microplus]
MSVRSESTPYNGCDSAPSYAFSVASRLHPPSFDRVSPSWRQLQIINDFEEYGHTCFACHAKEGSDQQQ